MATQGWIKTDPPSDENASGADPCHAGQACPARGLSLVPLRCRLLLASREDTPQEASHRVRKEIPLAVLDEVTGLLPDHLFFASAEGERALAIKLWSFRFHVLSHPDAV